MYEQPLEWVWEGEVAAGDGGERATMVDGEGQKNQTRAQRGEKNGQNM